jgi:hypothetical protein
MAEAILNEKDFTNYLELRALRHSPFLQKMQNKNKKLPGQASGINDSTVKDIQ